MIQTLFFPESPRFNYSKERFDESRAGLTQVAKINRNEGYTDKYKFDTEKEMIDIASEGGDAKTEHKLDGGNVYGITQSEYIKNLIIMCLLFTCFSFCFWLVDFQQEYLGTDMFILFYAQGVVCIISGQLNLFLYPILGLRNLVFWT